MDQINDISNIGTSNPNVPNYNVPNPNVNNVPNASVPNVGTNVIGVDDIGNQFINVGGVWVRNPEVRNLNEFQEIRISDRGWMQSPPEAIPIVVPVTVRAGTPIVNIPGCVKVNKENAKNPRNKNKQLVNDDPKQNVVLCDGGMPYYEPPDYDYRDLTWQTVNTNNEQEPEGMNTEEPDLMTPETPNRPEIPKADGPIDCPPSNARRIGDLNQAGTEKVIGYKLTPDGKICETQWEELSFTEQYLPSVPIVSTTATIAVVATSSALLAKPLADLLLKVVKPVVKKVLAKVNKIRGKKEKVLSRQERLLAQRDRNRAIMELRKALKK